MDVPEQSKLGKHNSLPILTARKMSYMIHSVSGFFIDYQLTILVY